MSDEELKCLWNLDDSECGGEIKERTFFGGFGGQIKCPACEAHFHQHEEVMRLVGSVGDINKVLNEAVFLPDGTAIMPTDTKYEGEEDE